MRRPRHFRPLVAVALALGLLGAAIGSAAADAPVDDNGVVAQPESAAEARVERGQRELLESAKTGPADGDPSTIGVQLPDGTSGDIHLFVAPEKEITVEELLATTLAWPAS